ncbi:serine/arginine repetitive matrix protein 1-like [Budorcas taxicolor]|uniref:serine/arginine repetitive matrix protein 1-like n=1 Tax=Budorcas taxicolor TaxID=37181 RepID=UPI002284ECF9|nr:serine/arginine repetitive matrix protein 1-like [Budorcas taxicolor]
MATARPGRFVREEVHGMPDRLHSAKKDGSAPGLRRPGPAPTDPAPARRPPPRARDGAAGDGAARRPPGPLPASAPPGRLSSAERVLRRGPQRPAPRAAPCRGAGKGRRPPPPPPAGKSLLGCNPARARGGRAAPRSLALTHPLAGTSSRALEIPAGRRSAPGRARAPPPPPARARARVGAAGAREGGRLSAPPPRAPPPGPARARRPSLRPSPRRPPPGLSNGAAAPAGAGTAAPSAAPPPRARARPAPGASQPPPRASPLFRVEKPRKPRGGPKGSCVLIECEKCGQSATSSQSAPLACEPPPLPGPQAFWGTRFSTGLGSLPRSKRRFMEISRAEASVTSLSQCPFLYFSNDSSNKGRKFSISSRGFLCGTFQNSGQSAPGKSKQQGMTWLWGEQGHSRGYSALAMAHTASRAMRRAQARLRVRRLLPDGGEDPRPIAWSRGSSRSPAVPTEQPLQSGSQRPSPVVVTSGPMAACAHRLPAPALSGNMMACPTPGGFEKAPGASGDPVASVSLGETTVVSGAAQFT